MITFSWKAILHSHGATASTQSAWESGVESRIAASERILNEMHGMLQLTLANPASAANPASDVGESQVEQSASREPVALLARERDGLGSGCVDCTSIAYDLKKLKTY